MKLLIYILSCWISVFGILTSCSDDLFTGSNMDEVKEGVPVTIKLNFGVTSRLEQTRSAQSEENEKRINRLFFIAFDNSGNISGAQSFENVNNTTGTGYIQVSMKSGRDQRIFLVGNPESGVGTLDVEALEKVKNYEQFCNLYSRLRSSNKCEVNRSGFLMLGQMDKDDDGLVTVNEKGELSGVTNRSTVELERVDARITFNVTAHNDDYINFEFKPKYYRVENIPQGTFLVPREKGSGKDNTWDYTGDEGADNGYASMAEENQLMRFDTDNSFDFYILENRCPYKSRIESNDEGADNLYALREKRIKLDIGDDDEKKEGQKVVNGDFEYANPHSTYVTIRGTLSYMTKDNKFVNADVTYTVHLGNTGNSETKDWYNNPDLVNNYDTERNTHYTYNVTITGVTSMEVEVKQDEEKRPGVEGDVIVAGNEVNEMDAHYGRKLFTLTKDEILNGLSWAVSTPFQRGLKVFDEENFNEGQESSLQTDGDLNDYKWVKFAINREYPSHEGAADNGTYSPNLLVKFPGEQAYDGGKGNINSGGTPAPAFGISDQDAFDSKYYGCKVKLYDVNQLLNHLYVEAKKKNSPLFENDETVAITAFVDEYVYKYDPTKVYYEGPNEVEEGDPDLLLWKQTVNGDNRMLHICKRGAKYSSDGNTSWAESVITFSQTPIFTFYNPNSIDLKTAWGTESIREHSGDLDGRLMVTSKNTKLYKAATSASNGRLNTLGIIPTSGNLKWSEVVSVHDEGALNDGYQSIWYACLLRNRDLDGDDIIDPEEIRWYLASIDQLTDLWIGEDAIPNAKLYQENVTNYSVPKLHVASSTYYSDSWNNPWVIWAEEGASRGSYSDSKTYNGEYYDYRCVRNLGLSLSNINEIPQDYVISSSAQTRYANNEAYTEYVIDVSHLESNTIRPAYPNTPLPIPLFERDDNHNNRPYQKFAFIVSATNQPDGLYGSNTWLHYYNYETNGYPCPQGYRIPNQRELMLMYTTYPEKFEISTDLTLMCKTKFSFDGYSGYSNRTGFVFGYFDSNYNMYLMNAYDVNVKIRCVRDVVD